MTDVVLTAPRLFTGEAVLAPGWVHMRDGRIVAVDTGAPPAGAPLQALPCGWLAPGFVDLQCNGGLGTDFTASTPDDWQAVLRHLPLHGVTSVVPTLVTAPLPVLADQIAAYREGRSRLDHSDGAARTLGLHIEGPFLSRAQRGAHPTALLRHPTPLDVRLLLQAAAGEVAAPDALPAGADTANNGALAYVTLAPELPGAGRAIRQLTAADVRVAVGHTEADADTVHAALTQGATLITHLFNAQRPFHHRDPGVVGVALADPRPWCGLIADPDHVDPLVVRLAFAALGDRVLLVTDATAATGLAPGRHTLGGETIEVADDRPPVRPDGTLAGSVLTMDAAVRNAVASGVGVTDALAAATRTPARALGRRDIGRLGAGCAADLVWLSDDLEVRGTWIDGQAVSPAGSRP